MLMQTDNICWLSYSYICLTKLLKPRLKILAAFIIVHDSARQPNLLYTPGFTRIFKDAAT